MTAEGRANAGVPRRPPRKRQTVREMVFFVALVVTIVAAGAALVWMGVVLREGTVPPEGDRAVELADIETFTRVIPAGPEGWIAELPPTWTGQPARIAAACEKALERLHAAPNQTLTIVGPEGTPVADCGAGK